MSNLAITFPPAPLPGVPMKFVVIVPCYQGQWLLCRQKTRQTFELPGGHIDPGETPEAAARRELWEETGAMDVTLTLVCPYAVEWGDHSDGGYLFFAEVQTLGELPPEYEMAETGLFSSLPAKQSWPQLHPPLFEQVQRWLICQSNGDELWDIYDENRQLTGRIQRRGDPLQPGDRHLVVHIWIQNSRGEFLITQRAPNKGYPLLWECTGGSALVGDDSLTAALREVFEETGLTLLPENGRVVITQAGGDRFGDIWLFRQDADLADVVLQPGETVDARWASRETVLAMRDNGEFFDYDYLNEFFKGRPE